MLSQLSKSFVQFVAKTPWIPHLIYNNILKYEYLLGKNIVISKNIRNFARTF